MSKYEIIIYWSAEDDAFVAEVPELPGCCAHGPSYEVASANAQEAIRLRIETAKGTWRSHPGTEGVPADLRVAAS